MSSARMRKHRTPMWKRLSPHQVQELSLAHHQNLDAIAHRQADGSTLWQWAGGVLTWSKAASLIQAGVPEMAEQLELLNAVVERYRANGQVSFDGNEYDLARKGVIVMDAIAAEVPLPKAIEAANWSERQVQRAACGGPIG